MILEMVDNDELDLNFMALLQTNINTARQAGQEDAAQFMEKIYKAAVKTVEGVISNRDDDPVDAAPRGE